MPDRLLAAVRAARRIVVLSGAGMSAESGIPTFRDALTGLWSRFDPMVLASPAGFRKDPALVWGWYEARRRTALGAMPNGGHVALSDLARLPWVEDFAIVTQNVDDLHERAGSRQVTHLHGSLFSPRCEACDALAHDRDWHAIQQGDALIEDAPVAPPRCTRCGGQIRPGVVWFGEGLPEAEWQHAVGLTRAADLMLVVGTSGTVYPAASLPDIAVREGAAVWVIDPAAPESNDDSHARMSWRSKAVAALRALATASR